MGFSEYTTKNTEEIFRQLKTSGNGLSEKEAEERRRVFGFNEIKTRESGLPAVLIRQFKSPFFYLLFLAALIAFTIGERLNGLIILSFVFINVLLGFFQEAKAVKTAKLLKKYVPLKVRVKRGGEEKIIGQRFLVPGDLVLLEAGNIAPADLRLIKAKNFLVDEEVLSGESVPLTKKAEPLSEEAEEIFQAENIVFAASSVVSGEAEGLVIATGRKTFFGEIVKLTAEAKRESVYEKNLFKFSRIVLRIVVFSIIALFLANFLIKGTSNFFDFLIFCIALIVSIIPEALPLVTTFAFSRGALSLAKNKVVVKRLSAIEDLGDIEILCSDKTGTITENKLVLEEIFSRDKEKCLLYGLLSSALVKEEIDSSQNCFDQALFQRAGPEIQEQLSRFRQIREIPFDNNRLRNSALLEDNSGQKILIVKGAPEVVLKLCSDFGNQQNSEQIKEEIRNQGERGRRILALAYKDFSRNNYSEEEEKDLKFLGFFAFSDPLKKSAKPALKLAKKLGLQVKILTGDSLEVAAAVGKEIGLVKDQKEVVSGQNLESLSEEDFEAACQNFQIFARLSPKTKFRIVESLQKKFEVGFLGEGINDAPSLKKANVAIAVKDGADVSRQSADIILLRKDLRVIIEGIKKGRNIFSNVNKYIKCTLSSNFGNFYSIALISLFIPFLPMLPIQILLVNLLSDFPLIAIASDKVDSEELKKPKTCQLNQLVFLMFLLALISSLFDLAFFFLFFQTGAKTLQTLWFIESILTEIVLIFSIRTNKFFLKTKAPGLALLFFALLAAAITLILPFTIFGREFFSFALPSIPQISLVLFLIFAYFLASEITKLAYFRYRRT